MDDHKFDDIIKVKLDDYEDPSFDPSALAALHTRLDSQTGSSFYNRYRQEILVGGATILIILFMLWGQRYFTADKNIGLQKELQMLQQQNENLAALLNEIKKSKTPVADTIKLIEIRERDPYLYARLTQQLRELKSAILDSLMDLQKDYVRVASVRPVDRASYTGYFERPSYQLKPGNLFISPVDSVEKNDESLKQELKKLSTKELIKKGNYRKGVGIRIGPTAELSQGFYKAGSGEINMGYGLLGDFILSPVLSFETGVKYAHRFYSVGENELGNITLPSVNQTIGNVKLAEVDTWILEIPLNLKYRLPLTTKISFVSRLGYSSLIYFGQRIEYSYEYDPTKNLFVKDSHKQNEFLLSPGALNISIGLSRQLKTKKLLEGGLFYQQGLGKMGAERNNTSYFGIRGVYWITLQ
jgi:hypothetical protein